MNKKETQTDAIPVLCAHGELVPIERMVGNPRNPNTHPASQIELLAKIISSQGWRAPITVSTRSGFVVRGHGRLAAAHLLGLETVPVDFQEYESEAAEWADLIADNRIAELAEVDEGLLAGLLLDIDAGELDLELTGFDASEFERLLTAVGGMDIVEDEVPEPPEEPVTKLGDLWLLGEHRLLCGDAADPKALDCLMNGTKAQAMWTDPPYGVDYVGKTKDALTIENDGATGLPALLNAAFTGAARVLEPGAPFYVSHPAGVHSLVFGEALLAAGFKIHQCLVWVKDSMVLGHSDYHYRHEPIWYGWNAGEGRSGRGKHAGSHWRGDNSQTSVFEIPRPKRSEEHPTTKPVELIAQCLSNSTRKNDIVFDPFLGSGTTLIASEQLGRICCGVEIDPAYVDVCLTRWSALTGKEAVLDGTSD